jgi:hypothetical protein
MISPSILAHTLNGALFILAFILIYSYYSSINKLSSIIIVLLLSIAVGVHGLSHLGLEYVYGYSPYSIFKTEGFQGGCPMMRLPACQMRAVL